MAPPQRRRGHYTGSVLILGLFRFVCRSLLRQITERRVKHKRHRDNMQISPVAKDNRPVIKKLLGGCGSLKKKGGREGGEEKGSQRSVVFQLHLRRSLFQTKQKKFIAAVEYCDPRSLKDVFVSHISLYHSYIIR